MHIFVAVHFTPRLCGEIKVIIFDNIFSVALEISDILVLLFIFLNTFIFFLIKYEVLKHQLVITDIAIHIGIFVFISLKIFFCFLSR